MLKQLAGAALASAMLLSGGWAMADHLEILNNGLTNAETKSEKGQAAAQNQPFGSSQFLPYTTDGHTPIGRGRAEEHLPADKFSTLRDSRK